MVVSVVAAVAVIMAVAGAARLGITTITAAVTIPQSSPRVLRMAMATAAVSCGVHQAVAAARAAVVCAALCSGDHRYCCRSCDHFCHYVHSESRNAELHVDWRKCAVPESELLLLVRSQRIKLTRCGCPAALRPGFGITFPIKFSNLMISAGL